MTPLGRLIRETIAAEGPMRLDRYMALCLSHPAHGYYATRDPFGARGDFVTAPEISQMFGELIGLWCAEAWRMMGSPKRFALVELGPGRGAMMADMLRAARAAPRFLDAAEVVLVETSPTLRAVQESTLAGAGTGIRWAASVDEACGGLDPSPCKTEQPRSLPLQRGGQGGDRSGSSSVLDDPHPTLGSRQGPPSPLQGEGFLRSTQDLAALPAIVVANEFFDALPIRQFARTEGGWRERLVGLGDEGALAFGLAPDAPHDLDLPDAPVGAVREVSAEALDVAARLGAHVSAHGGAVLAIDYGYGAGHGDTFQALAAHGFADPLANPGEADLTAHADFFALAAAAHRAGAAVMRLISQADLLDRLGLRMRAERLSATASLDQRAAIAAAVARLTDQNPRGMGALFKALAFGDPRLGALPGFEPVRSAA